MVMKAVLTQFRHTPRTFRGHCLALPLHCHSATAFFLAAVRRRGKGDPRRGGTPHAYYEMQSRFLVPTYASSCYCLLLRGPRAFLGVKSASIGADSRFDIRVDAVQRNRPRYPKGAGGRLPELLRLRRPPEKYKPSAAREAKAAGTALERGVWNPAELQLWIGHVPASAFGSSSHPKRPIHSSQWRARLAPPGRAPAAPAAAPPKRARRYASSCYCLLILPVAATVARAARQQLMVDVFKTWTPGRRGNVLKFKTWIPGRRGNS